MRVRGLGLAMIVGWALAGAASAACLAEGPAPRAFTGRDVSERSIGLLVMSSTLLQMDPYAPKTLKRLKGVCEAARLRNGKSVYVVQGTAEAAMPRIVTSNDRKAALFMLMTVPDLTGILPKANLPAGPLGYVLASRDDTNAVVYRAYDAIPPDVQLASEIGAALEGRIPAMLAVDVKTHQVRMTTQPDAGTVREAAAPAAPAAP